MEFATLQRPSYEDLERRRRMREGSPPPRGPPGGPAKGLQRKDSVLTRGLNALRRRQSMVSNRKTEYEASFSTQPFTSLQTPDPEPPLSMMTTESTNARRQSYNFPNPPPGGRPGLTRSRSVLARARSFKHPEHFSQIPPMEITRMRSKSQMRMPDQQQQQTSGNLSSSSGVFSYDEAEMYAGYSGSSGSSHHGGRMKSGYQSLVDVVAYNGRGGQGPSSTGGPAWLQNTLPQNPRPLARSTSVKPGHMRAGFFNNMRQQQDAGNARPRRRDLSEPTPPPPPVPPVVRPTGRDPTPGSARKRQPLPNIFYYGSQDQPPSPNNIDERYSQCFSFGDLLLLCKCLAHIYFYAIFVEFKLLASTAEA